MAGEVWPTMAANVAPRTAWSVEDRVMTDMLRPEKPEVSSREADILLDPAEYPSGLRERIANP